MRERKEEIVIGGGLVGVSGRQTDSVCVCLRVTISLTLASTFAAGWLSIRTYPKQNRPRLPRTQVELKNVARL